MMPFDTVRVVKHHSMFGLSAHDARHVFVAMCVASFVAAFAATLRPRQDVSTSRDDAMALGLGLVAWLATFFVAMVVMSLA